MTDTSQHIDSFTMQDSGTGVVWTMSWDASGQVSYKGVDANGNTVSAEPPSFVLNAVSEREAKRNSEAKPEEAKGAENKESKEAPENSKSSSEQKSKARDSKEVMGEFVSKNPGLKSISISSKGEIKTNPPEMVKNLSEEDKKFWTDYLRKFDRKEQVNDTPRGLVDKFEGRGGVKSLARGSLKEDLKQTFNQMKADGKDVLNEVVRLPKDLVKAGNLIAQGKFRELRDRLALRIHDNLEAMGVLSERTQERINEANKKIEGRLGITNREKNPDLPSRMVGRGVHLGKRVVSELRGIGENASKTSRGQRIQNVPARNGAER